MTGVDALHDLLELAKTTIHRRMWAACDAVLSDPRFIAGIASSSHHPEDHQVPGGLAVHTLEVAREAVALAGTDKDLAALAYVAAVFHDFGKIHEYLWRGGKVVSLPFKDRVGHVTWGWAYWIETANAAGGFDGVETEEIAHAILAHMGRLEWKSPVTPQTRLAYILHTADMFSAKGLA